MWKAQVFGFFGGMNGENHLWRRDFFSMSPTCSHAMLGDTRGCFGCILSLISYSFPGLCSLVAPIRSILTTQGVWRQWGLAPLLLPIPYSWIEFSQVVHPRWALEQMHEEMVREGCRAKNKGTEAHSWSLGKNSWLPIPSVQLNAACDPKASELQAQSCILAAHWGIYSKRLSRGLGQPNRWGTHGEEKDPP